MIIHLIYSYIDGFNGVKCIKYLLGVGTDCENATIKIGITFCKKIKGYLDKYNFFTLYTKVDFLKTYALS